MATAPRIGFVGYLSVLLLVPLLVPELSAVLIRQVNLNQTYTWGFIRPRDTQIAGGVLKFPPGYNMKRTYNSPKLASGTRISAVQVIDLWQNGTNANITEVSFPQDRTWVKITFAQQNGKGMAYTVKVWGSRY